VRENVHLLRIMLTYIHYSDHSCIKRIYYPECIAKLWPCCKSAAARRWRQQPSKFYCSLFHCSINQSINQSIFV